MKLFTSSSSISAISILAVLVSASTVIRNASAEDQSKHIILMPAELKWDNLSVLPPGAKVAVIHGNPAESGPFTVRVKLPGNYKIPAHSHSVAEEVTVLSGTFNGGVGDKLDSTKTKPVPAGGVVIMPANMNHFAWTKQPTVVQISGMGPFDVKYVNPEDDPRKQ
jgi:quercetin dioxygenase-like cupin family protein